MKTILQKALTLDKYDFIDQIISLNQNKITTILDSNDSLKLQYHEKVLKLLEEGLHVDNWHKDMHFAESNALIQLLNPEQRGRVFFASTVQKNNFTAAYNAVQNGFVLSDKVKEFIPNLVLDEVSRLTNDSDFSHLEKNINYLNYTDNGFKPFLDSSLYAFVLYASFIHHVRKGLKLNNQQYLHMVDMLTEEDLKTFKTYYSKNTNSLISAYKKRLHFDYWPAHLKSLFYTDINTPNPYNSGGISSWRFTIEQFKPYGEILEKFILHDSFEHQFPATGHHKKSLKI